MNLSICPTPTACNANILRCTTAGKQLNPNGSCADNADCASDMYCASGFCNDRIVTNSSVKCSNDDDCEDSAACYEGICKKLCRTDNTDFNTNTGEVCRPRAGKTLGVCLLGSALPPQVPITGDKPDEAVPKKGDKPDEEVPEKGNTPSHPKKSDKTANSPPAAVTKPTLASAPGFLQKYLPAWTQRSPTTNEFLIGGAALFVAVILLVLLFRFLCCKSKKRRSSEDVELPRVASQPSRRF